MIVFLNFIVIDYVEIYIGFDMVIILINLDYLEILVFVFGFYGYLMLLYEIGYFFGLDYFVEGVI